MTRSKRRIGFRGRPAKPRLRALRPVTPGRVRTAAKVAARSVAAGTPPPLTPEQQTWDAAVNAILGLLLRVKVAPSIHGEKWTLGMRRYYRQRLAPLLTTPPPGMEDRAAKYAALADTM